LAFHFRNVKLLIIILVPLVLLLPLLLLFQWTKQQPWERRVPSVALSLSAANTHFPFFSELLTVCMCILTRLIVLVMFSETSHKTFFYPICFGKCCPPLTYTNRSKGTNVSSFDFGNCCMYVVLVAINILCFVSLSH
jgi:hypothetical protein